MTGDQLFILGVMISFGIILLYVVGGSYIEHVKLPFGHETGIALIIGFSISLLSYLANDQNFLNFFTFNETIFFYILLPPIVFASGFNMRRKKFFQNLGYILLYGVIGSFVCFGVFTCISYAFLYSGQLEVYNGTDKETHLIDINILSIMLISALLCSSDVIAAVCLVSYTQQPKLYSIIFGEGVVNDAVAIILFQTVDEFIEGGEEFNGATVFIILGQFILLGVVSLAIGIFFGFMGSYVLKELRFLTVSAIKETLFVFSVGFLAYTVSLVGDMSGIISLLTCSIILAHYAWFNLSPQGKHTSSVTLQVLGFLAEAFVFTYIGLSIFAYQPYDWSWQFILIELMAVVVGRFIAIAGLTQSLKLCRHKPRVSFRESLFVWFAGGIRGPIAFGLVLTISPEVEGQQVIVTTTLTLVLVTTLVFGTLMAFVQKMLIPSNGEAEGHAHGATQYKQTGISNFRSDEEIMSGRESRPTLKKVASNPSEHEEFLHPNLELSMDEMMSKSDPNPHQQQEQKFSWFKKLKVAFKNFDKFYLKKWFRYKYNPNEKRIEIADLFEQDAQRWDEMLQSEVQNIEQEHNRISMLMRNERVKSLFHQKIMTLKSMREEDPGQFMERARSHNEFASFEGHEDMQQLLKAEKMKSEAELLPANTSEGVNLHLNLEEVLLPNESSSPEFANGLQNSTQPTGFNIRQEESEAKFDEA